VNQPKAKLPRNQSPAYPTGRRLQMASDGNECARQSSILIDAMRYSLPLTSFSQL
jgi:hypothetical protein